MNQTIQVDQGVNMKRIPGKDQPLYCNIEGEELVIRIGIDTLAWAAEHNPRFFNPDKPYAEKYITVENNIELAHDVVGELNGEEEDGTTPLHLLLDEALFNAAENGSLGYAED